MTQFTRRDVSLCVPGEGDSHTLLFEARHNWTGLLVEPMVNGLLFKHRKVTADANIFSTSQIFSPGARGADVPGHGAAAALRAPGARVERGAGRRGHSHRRGGGVPILLYMLFKSLFRAL